jgi:hypothetical protein
MSDTALNNRKFRATLLMTVIVLLMLIWCYAVGSVSARLFAFVAVAVIAMSSVVCTRILRSEPLSSQVVSGRSTTLFSRVMRYLLIAVAVILLISALWGPKSAPLGPGIVGALVMCIWLFGIIRYWKPSGPGKHS